MTWTASGQVANAIESNPHARVCTLKTPAGATVGTFTGLFLHTQPDEVPMVYAARSATTAHAAEYGYTVTTTGFSAYTVEGVRSDGAYILQLVLRRHIRAS